MLDGGRIGEHTGEARAVEHVPPVQDLPERGEDVASVARPSTDPHRDLQRHHGGDGQEEGGQDAAGPVLPEPADRELPVLRPLGECDGRHEEAREREEAGQAEEPAACELEALVERQHRQQRHGPQAVERGDAGELGAGARGRPGGASPFGPAVFGVTQVGPGLGVDVGLGVVAARLVVGPRRLDDRPGRRRCSRPERAVAVPARAGLRPGLGWRGG
jgi:hypothetical protein